MFRVPAATCVRPGVVENTLKMSGSMGSGMGRVLRQGCAEKYYEEPYTDGKSKAILIIKQKHETRGTTPKPK